MEYRLPEWGNPIKHSLPDWVLRVVNDSKIIRETAQPGSYTIPAKYAQIQIYRPTSTCGLRAVGLWQGSSCTHFDLVRDAPDPERKE